MVRDVVAWCGMGRTLKKAAIEVYRHQRVHAFMRQELLIAAV